MKKKTWVIWLVLLLLIGAAGAFLVHREALRRAEEEHQRELDAVVEYTDVLTAEELSTLDQYQNLRHVDLRGSDCYDAILAYIAAKPEQEVLYSVPLGGYTAENTETELTLEPDEFDLDTLMSNLHWLPALRKITLPRTTLSREELATLHAAFPEGEIVYTVMLLGEEIPGDAEELDLTALGPAELDDAMRALRLLPALRRVELTDEEGGNLLGLEEVTKLTEAFPETLFVYRFELFGQTVSSEDERIEYVRVQIGDDGVETLREALPVLKSCRYFLLDYCGIGNELLSQLRDDFPQTKIVWRIYLTLTNFLTDIKVVHLTWTLTNQNVQVLRYCNEVEYFDIGHNTISDLSFMAYMTNLKYVILSYNYVKDLTPLGNLKKLEMLELYFCHLLSDISPLAGCENLKMLNISATAVRDISPVFGLKKLERFYCIMNYIPEEQKEQCFEELPDCWITFEQKIDKAVGWSFDAAGGVRAQWYLDMYKIFRYRVEPYFFGDYPEEFLNGA